jgi:hypothetical protein
MVVVVVAVAVTSRMLNMAKLCRVPCIPCFLPRGMTREEELAGARRLQSKFLSQIKPWLGPFLSLSLSFSVSFSFFFLLSLLFPPLPFNPDLDILNLGPSDGHGEKKWRKEKEKGEKREREKKKKKEKKKALGQLFSPSRRARVCAPRDKRAPMSDVPQVGLVHETGKSGQMAHTALVRRRRRQAQLM